MWHRKSEMQNMPKKNILFYIGKFESINSKQAFCAGRKTNPIRIIKSSRPRYIPPLELTRHGAKLRFSYPNWESLSNESKMQSRKKFIPWNAVFCQAFEENKQMRASRRLINSRKLITCLMLLIKKASFQTRGVILVSVIFTIRAIT